MENAKIESPKRGTTKEPIGIGDLAAVLFVFWGFIGAPIYIIWTLTPYWIKYPLIYAPIYQIGLYQVHAVKRPTDCEWWHAPLGGKGCDYKKHLLTKRNAAGRVTDVLVTWEKVQN